jgi:hypothetical protein
MVIANFIAHRANPLTKNAVTLQASSSSQPEMVPTRSNQIGPTVGLTFRSRDVQYDRAPGRNYPSKLNVYFSNDGDDIHLGVAKWIKDQVGLQAGKPQGIVYLLKNHLGRWQSESIDKFVPSGSWVKMWVGLDSSVPDNELKQLTEEGRLGILEIPAEIAGAAIRIRIHL